MPARTRRPVDAERIPSCFTCQSRDKAEWCVLVDDDLRLLDQSKRAFTYSAGHVLYHQGDPFDGVHCIESGTVALRISDAQGNSMLVRLAHAGHTVGYRGFFGDGHYATTAEVLQPATICRIGAEPLRTALAHNPGLGLKFLTHLAGDLAEVEEAMLRQSAHTVRVRVAHLLLSLKERYGEMEDEGSLVIALPMARQDMAALLGARPETIARALHELQADQVVRFEGRKAIVADLDTLLDEIEPLPG